MAYRLHASLHLRDAGSTGKTHAKFSEMFKRRARKGQCFNQPYLGTREFSCAFALIEQEALEQERHLHPAIAEDRELGWMLYDMDFSDSANPAPRFFNARMVSGGITVPGRDSEAIRG